MRKRSWLSVFAVPAAVSALLGGVPALAHAMIVPPAGGASTASDVLYGAMTPALASELSQHVDTPVIVVLKSQFAQAPVGTAAASARSAAVSAMQASLLNELSEVHATGVKRFTLVNSVAATVSPLEERRLAASPAVAQVIPDATVTIPPPSLTSPAVSAAPAVPARITSLKPRVIPGACAPRGRSQLAPEGLALTSTASGNSRQPTARSLGITGAGVKVAYIADGIDPRNVNFLRRNGRSVFVDYKDFSGDGLGKPTTGGEAFLDANTIAGQGTHVYNVNGFSAQSYPGTCDVRIQGVAPGVSLVGLNIFSNAYVTTNSAIAEAINYAVERDHVNVLNESFGANTFPDTSKDVIKLFDDAAVRAGVVVSVSSGDSGVTSTIGSPATDPNVISVGATTQFQMYAQSNFGLARYFARGWLSDNISAITSAGYDEAGRTIDMVAPGDLSWASCDANVAMFSDCTNVRGKPSPIEISGGTSEAAPFVSGAAALVIQAYRKTHGGRTPSPALVKQILMSTATDLNVPAQEQGAGLLNSYKAVQLAESIGRSARTGATLLASATQLNYVGMPGSSKSWRIWLTNTGTKRQTVRVYGRTLGPDRNVRYGHVSLNDSTSSQLVAESGVRENYAIFRFRVPAGQSRLDVSIAYSGNPNTLADGPHLTLIDPRGRLAAYSLPQGAIPDYGNVDVRTPVGGIWTGVIAGLTAGQGGYNGTVTWRVATERFAGFGSASPSSVSIPPGARRAVRFTVRAPSSPGDTAGSIALSSSLGGPTSIPVTVRSLINVNAGGAFSGVLTGGNGRGAVVQDLYYSFRVPAGVKAVTASLAMANDPKRQVTLGTYLVAPDGNALGYGQNFDNTELQATQTGPLVTNPTVDASVLNPHSGTWTLVVDLAGLVPGTEFTDPFTGHVTFTAPGTETGALPDSAATTLAAGQADMIPVTVTNTSNATQDYFLDPRLTGMTTLSLAPLGGSSTQDLPLQGEASFFVPTQSSSIMVRQTSTVPAMTDLSPVIGDPGVVSTGMKAASLCARSVSAGYTPPGGALTWGLWNPEPTECGPYQSTARSGKATDTVTVWTRAFDPAMAATYNGVPLSDLMTLAESSTAVNLAAPSLVELAPGQSATVDVTITPSGKAGSKVTGTLYLVAAAAAVQPYAQLAGDEVAALPYEYTIG